jgi:hypothetical protein
MIKKLCISLLLSLKIISSDLESGDCLTSYFGCSTTTACSLGENICMKGSIVGCSAVAFKTGECFHRQLVYNFDSDNKLDRGCAKVSGLLATRYCLDSLAYAQCPSCLPIIGLIAFHNVFKVAEESMTDPLSAPYNQPKHKDETFEK